MCNMKLGSSGRCISGCCSALVAYLDDVCICCEVNQGISSVWLEIVVEMHVDGVTKCTELFFFTVTS